MPRAARTGASGRAPLRSTTVCTRSATTGVVFRRDSTAHVRGDLIRLSPGIRGCFHLTGGSRGALSCASLDLRVGYFDTATPDLRIMNTDEVMCAARRRRAAGRRGPVGFLVGLNACEHSAWIVPSSLDGGEPVRDAAPQHGQVAVALLELGGQLAHDLRELGQRMATANGPIDVVLSMARTRPTRTRARRGTRIAGLANCG